MILISYVHLGKDLLLRALSSPLILQKIPPTLADPDLWYAVNRYWVRVCKPIKLPNA